MSKSSAVRVVSAPSPLPLRKAERTIVSVDPRELVRRWNSRRVYPSSDGLRESLQSDGMMVTPEVRSIGGNKLELIHGERRVRYAIELGWSRIDVTLVQCDPLGAQVRNVIENRSRSNLAAWELAEAFSEMQAEHNLSYAALARRVHLSAPYVQNLIQVRRRLDPLIWQQLRDWGDGCRVGWNQLVEIAALDRLDQQREWQRRLDRARGIVRRGREIRPGPRKLERYLTRSAMITRSPEYRRGVAYGLKVALGLVRFNAAALAADENELASDAGDAGDEI